MQKINSIRKTDSNKSLACAIRALFDKEDSVRILGLAAFAVSASVFVMLPQLAVAGNRISVPTVKITTSGSKQTPEQMAADNLAEIAYETKYKSKDKHKIEDSYTRALAAIEKGYGKASVKEYDTLVQLGTHYEEAGEFDKAIAVEKDACQVWTQICGKVVDWNKHVMIIYNLGPLLASKKSEKEAVAQFQYLAKKEAAVVGPDHPMVQNTYSGLGSLYDNRKEYAAAETVYAKVLEALGRSVSKTSPEYMGAQADLGGILLKENKKDQAKKLLAPSYAWMKKNYGDEAPVTQWVARILAEASKP
jgi:tetratricopeptide (TPR) repeat protein